jgi:hypothetical protein
MAANSQRHSYPLAELARIRTGGQRTIQAIHANQCPSLTQSADCTCDNVTYRMVTARKGARGR